MLIGPVVWAATIDLLRRPPTPELIADAIKRQAEVEAEMLGWLDRVAAETNGKHAEKSL